MQTALDRSTLDRLIALGQRQGHLTNADLQEHLPVQAMRMEDIAMIVLQLEESGIAVELEDDLLSAGQSPKPVPTGGAQIIPFPRRPVTPPKPRPKAEALRPAIRPLKSPTDQRQSHASAHWAVAGAGVLALTVLALLILV